MCSYEMKRMVNVYIIGMDEIPYLPFTYVSQDCHNSFAYRCTCVKYLASFPGLRNEASKIPYVDMSVVWFPVSQTEILVPVGIKPTALSIWSIECVATGEDILDKFCCLDCLLFTACSWVLFWWNVHYLISVSSNGFVFRMSIYFPFKHEFPPPN